MKNLWRASRGRAATLLTRLAGRLEIEPARRQLLSLAARHRDIAPASSVAPRSPEGKAAISYWFDAMALADRQINEACFAYYDKKHPKHYLWTGHAQFLLDSLSPNDRVLDIGCSNSAYSAWLAEKASHVVAIDINPARIEEASRANNRANLEYRVMDATKELPEGEFDLAICSHVLEHLDDPLELLSRLAERVRKLVIRVPLEDSGWMKLVKKDLGLPWLDDPDHRREYCESMLEEQLASSGWRILTMFRGLDLRAIAVPREPSGRAGE